MSRPIFPKRKPHKLTKAQKERRKRAEKAAVRRIAREEHITQKEARKLYKDAIVETIFSRPKKYAQRKFIEISPGKFREIPKGKPFKETEAVGPVRTTGYIQKVIKLKRHWEFARLMSEEYRITIQEARARIKRKELKIEDLYALYFAPRSKSA